mmetsp:Transcript_405/g.1366  ORF Transcript_405/g.1366 Transcript_405/m.1366 type:complete len:233 (-) Transcript_405:626-1324(-)
MSSRSRPSSHSKAAQSALSVSAFSRALWSCGGKAIVSSLARSASTPILTELYLVRFASSCSERRRSFCSLSLSSYSTVLTASRDCAGSTPIMSSCWRRSPSRPSSASSSSLAWHAPICFWRLARMLLCDSGPVPAMRCRISFGSFTPVAAWIRFVAATCSSICERARFLSWWMRVACCSCLNSAWRFASASRSVMSLMSSRCLRLMMRLRRPPPAASSRTPWSHLRSRSCSA